MIFLMFAGLNLAEANPQNKEVLMQSDLIINTFARQTTNLDGTWDIIIDPYQTGYYDYRYQPNPNGYFRNRSNVEPDDAWEYNFELSDKLEVPGDWNTQMEKLHWYEGTIWYKKDFHWELERDKRVFIYFGAVNYDARVWINGEYAGRHIGGFTPFNFEVTDLIQDGDNFVVVMADNTRKPEAVPTVVTDWANYGGITRSVTLIETEQTFVQDYYIQLNQDKDDEIIGWVRLNGDQLRQEVHIHIPEENSAHTVQTDSDGFASFTFPAEVTRWSTTDPRLYDVKIIAETDEITDQIGFRTIETAGTDILLNGKPIFLRGVNIHEEAPYRTGRAHSLNDARILLDWVEDMGANFVRLSHYPHNEHMVREAERRGILVWSEIPLYWMIQWDNPETLENARNQLSEMIHRDKNRAAVILWAMSNEAPVTDARVRFLQEMIKTTKELDPFRLTTAALQSRWIEEGENITFMIDDPIGEYLDVLGINQYYGWYGGENAPMDHLTWATIYDKPLLMSEFGAGAKQGWNVPPEQRWSEEFQAELYRHTLDMFDKIEFLSGTAPWILMDFRSPRRPLPHVKDGFNRKGLVSETGIRKKAFEVMKEYYERIEKSEE
ncbi:MAG: beta galactosidase jelly roll domain-containing protein [Balneolaceae bacterium]|nr:beta galactosidase jelly roll domain-containing protein [Balneolaceae bacterium]